MRKFFIHNRFKIWRRRQFIPSPFNLSVLILLAAMLLFSQTTQGQPPPPFEKAAGIINNGGFIVTKAGRVIAQLRQDDSFVPASTWKLATAALALHLLGNDYRFKTLFYQDRHGQLFIKGMGDPFLISEEIEEIIPALEKRLKGPISRIIIDDTAFQLNTRTEGSGFSLNPYDSDLSALAVNFNTINLRVNGKDIHSAEKQTPDLPIMAKLGRNLSPGTHRIALTDPKNIICYAGQLFKALEPLGPHNTSSQAALSALNIRRGKVPQGLQPIYIHHSSKSLQEVIKALFLYSNNFIANQIFLTCGAERFGWPATWDKARRTLREFLKRTVKLSPVTYRVMEGSGLSRKNTITPAAMLKLLYYFQPYAKLLPLHHNQRIKSGTLTGVYSYAGYFGNKRQRDLDPFVLILNQPVNKRDLILHLLVAGYQDSP